MTHPLHEIMQSIDTVCEQDPEQAFGLSFEDLAALQVPSPSDARDPATAAFSRLVQGLWLYYLGSWCPEQMTRLTWGGLDIVGTDEAPLGYTLMMAGIAVRSAGCRQASVGASASDIAGLRRNPAPTLAHPLTLFRDVALSWMELLSIRAQEHEDCFVQPLPASVESLSALFELSSPHRHQGNTSIVSPLEVGRQTYFVKRPIQPSSLLRDWQVFTTECAVTAALNACTWKLGPRTGCLYVADDGMLCYLSSKVPGIVMTDIRKAASRVSLAAVQTAVLYEFLLQIGDRHCDNDFIDRFRAQPWLIDFADALGDSLDVLLLPDADEPLDVQRESFTRALWTWHPDCIRTSTGEIQILDDVLADVRHTRQAMVEALRPYHLANAAIVAINQRFAVLDQLDAMPADKTIEELNRLIDLQLQPKSDILSLRTARGEA